MSSEREEMCVCVCVCLCVFVCMHVLGLCTQGAMYVYFTKNAPERLVWDSVGSLRKEKKMSKKMSS